MSTSPPYSTHPPKSRGWLSQLNIRHLRSADLPELEWGGQYAHFRRLFSDAYLRAKKGESVLWVVELPNAGIIGQLFIQLESPRNDLADGSRRAYMYAFRIRPAYRGSGVGTLLMDIAEADLKQRGFRRVCLSVARNNLAARRLYERLGFRVVSAEPGIWSYLDHRGRLREVNEPAWLMEKEI